MPRIGLTKNSPFVRPQVIIALGSVALKYLLSPNARITKDRGQWFTTKYGIPAIATYHPGLSPPAYRQRSGESQLGSIL
ncbi:hypothetical protein [Sporomusa carbonis]|uniref:hypothetical protein n=1 Tax=Sporomusa carbonis TaxID=3076075 RepID=UPI003C799A36